MEICRVSGLFRNITLRNIASESSVFFQFLVGAFLVIFLKSPTITVPNFL